MKDKVALVDVRFGAEQDLEPIYDDVVELSPPGVAALGAEADERLERAARGGEQRIGNTR